VAEVELGKTELAYELLIGVQTHASKTRAFYPGARCNSPCTIYRARAASYLGFFAVLTIRQGDVHKADLRESNGFTLASWVDLTV